MKMHLLQINGKYAGYTLVADNEEEKEALEVAQNLTYLASNKQDRMEYDGVMLDEKSKVLRMMFMQRKYSIIPASNPQKQGVYRKIAQEGVES